MIPILIAVWLLVNVLIALVLTFKPLPYRRYRPF